MGMISHHVQRQILRLLGRHEQARFTDIKPPKLENNAFQYHLHQLQAAKLVQKNEDGTYELTPDGKQEFIISHLSKTELHEQAHAIFLCALQNGDTWLVATRKVQPEIGLTGFIHGEPIGTEPIVNTAKRRFYDKTGLAADFTVKGAGYIRIFKDGNLSSFVHATLLFADSYSGNLKDESHSAVNQWVDKEELKEMDVIPSMPLLFSVLGGTAPPFFDATYEIN